MSFRKALENYFRKAPSVIAEFSESAAAQPRERKYNLAQLYKTADFSWILQEIYRVIIQEVKRPGWFNQFKFIVKCEDCTAKLQGSYEECPKCGSKNLRKPDPSHLAKANKLLERPNSSRQTFGDILGSMIYHDCVADEWLLSVNYATVSVKMNDTGDGVEKFYKAEIPLEIYVEHPGNVSPIYDDRGRLGMNEWFCPACFPDLDDKVEKDKFTCACGKEAVQTAYIQKINNEVKNRFGEDQMVHGSTYRVLPYPLGQPRLASLWELIHTLNAYNDWFFDTYATGKTGKLIDFKGYDPDQVKAMAIKMREAEMQLNIMDAATGDARPHRRVRNVLIGSQEGIEVHDMLPDPSKMQSLEYFMLGIHGVCGVYGVQPIMIAMKEDRAGGQTPYLKLEVNGHTIEEIQRDKAEIITNYLYPIFGIEDVEFKFGPIEKKDAERDARVALMRAQTVLTWRKAGFDVTIDEEGRTMVSNRAVEQPQPQGGEGESLRGQKESEASGASINETTVERYPKGPRDSMVV